MVDQGCIPPLCDLLTLTDAKTVQVALNGLENILKAGQSIDARDNPYAALIEECYGMTYLIIIMQFTTTGVFCFQKLNWSHVLIKTLWYVPRLEPATVRFWVCELTTRLPSNILFINKRTTNLKKFIEYIYIFWLACDFINIYYTSLY